MGGLQKLGYDVIPPKATFYVWLPVPQGMTSMVSPPICWSRPASSPSRGTAWAPGRGLRAPGPDGAQGTPGRGPGPPGEAGMLGRMARGKGIVSLFINCMV